MREIFDINLLSEIKGLDRKLSVSREHVTLKKQITEEQKNKGRQQMPKKQIKPNNESKEDKEEHLTVNITV